MLTTDKVFLDLLEKLNPGLAQELGEHAPTTQVFSSAVIPLPSSHWTMVKSFIHSAHTFSRRTDYKDYVAQKNPTLQNPLCRNESVMMSYDFHITEHGPKLIEINTNAALSAYAALWTESMIPGRGLKALDLFLDSFTQEAVAQGTDLSAGILIVDDNPPLQKAYGEFLIYKSLFIRKGIPCEIEDISNIRFDAHNRCWVSSSGFQAKAIYNRWNDFYLTQDLSRPLREGWMSGLLLTPQPMEYALLADKQRLLEWQQPHLLELLSQDSASKAIFEAVLPKTVPIGSFSRTMGRAERSHWFFKPKNSYGSRGVYEGSKLSNKVFENILLDDYLAQELVPPPSIQIQTLDGPKSFKWDLRVYAYKSQAILPIARAYIGQTTNSQTLGGGLAAIKVLDP